MSYLEHCLWRSVSQALHLQGEHNHGIEFFPRLTDTFTLMICCLLLRLSDSQPASWTSISENSNAFWNGWFRRQSKSQLEAVHWEPYLRAGILNLTRKAKTWKQVAGCIAHHIFWERSSIFPPCDPKIDIMLIYSTRPDGGLIPKYVKSGTVFPLSL